MFTVYETNTIDEKTELPPAAGRVYAIINPAWPKLVKIGCATDLAFRLKTYQTGTPYRDYKVIAWSHIFENVRRVEYAIHQSLAAYKIEASREWFEISHGKAHEAVRTAQTLSPIEKTIRGRKSADDEFAAYTASLRSDDPFADGIGSLDTDED